MPRQKPLSRDECEEIALRGLSALAEAPERLARFLSLSGLALGDVRELAAQPAFQAAMLTHIRGDESFLLAFSSNTGIPPERIAEAEAVLSGGPSSDRSLGRRT